jgi:hypothetical protein
MLSMFRKTMIGSIASLAIGFAAVGVSAPASAATWHAGNKSCNVLSKYRYV